MDAYTGFAAVYDEFMDDIPYGEWADRIVGILRERGVRDGIVLDLGCGTGNMTALLARAGYDMIGVDQSEDMLSIAMGKAIDEGLDILYLLQDMRKFELYGTVAAVVSVCDSLNYVTKEEELLEVFRLVNNYLDEGGWFFFDLNTERKYRSLGDSVIAENREDSAFIWENSYDEETRINQYDLAVFVREAPAPCGAECGSAESDTGGMRGDAAACGGEGVKEREDAGTLDEEDIAGADGEPFARFMETHRQRAYPLERVRELLAMAGMEFVAAYDGYGSEPPCEESERVCVLAREGHQEGKWYG